MSGDEKPRLAISLGDPAGIGPEVVLRALAQDAVRERYACCVVGDARLIAEAARRLDLPPPKDIDDAPNAACARGRLFEGRASAECGRAAAGAVRAAAELVRSGKADALVTAPLCKESLGLAGEPFPGHTELLAAQFDAPRVRMMLQGGGLRTVLVTTHHALRDVPALLTVEGIVETCAVAAESLARFGVSVRPRIAVAALNPHAGEAGRFGSEEAETIAPAVAQAQAAGLDVTGPHPADTLFAQAAQPDSGIDVVIALYHDQGLIPVKLAAFGAATNVTLGLPIVRVSPDHGTAFDIAGRGVAKPDSFVLALRVAAELCTRR